MPYYTAGDYAGRASTRYYTAGDYYQAGGFFGKLGKAFGGIAKVALPAVGTMFGGPIGGAAGLMVGNLLGAGKATGSSLPASNIMKPSGFGGFPTGGAGLFDILAPKAELERLDRALPGAVPGALTTPGRSVLPGYTVGRDGSIRRKGRRMNMLNPKALRRGMRRVQGFARFAKKTISFTQRVKMKKRRRS